MVSPGRSGRRGEWTVSGARPLRAVQPRTPGDVHLLLCPRVTTVAPDVLAPAEGPQIPGKFRGDGAGGSCAGGSCSASKLIILRLR